MSVPKFTWDKRRETSAAQLAAGKMTDDEIAADAGITRQGLVKWKKHPEFQARIVEIVEKTRQAVLTQGIADKVKRLAAYNDRWRRMQSVIDERATEMSNECAGGESGLLVHTTKQIGGGENATRVDEYAVDTGLLREMRELEKQAAIEIGDWVEKRDVKTDAKELLARLLGVPADALPDKPDAQSS